MLNGTIKGAGKNLGRSADRRACKLQPAVKAAGEAAGAHHVVGWRIIHLPDQDRQVRRHRGGCVAGLHGARMEVDRQALRQHVPRPSPDTRTATREPESSISMALSASAAARAPNIAPSSLSCKASHWSGAVLMRVTPAAAVHFPGGGKATPSACCAFAARVGPALRPRGDRYDCEVRARDGADGRVNHADALHPDRTGRAR